MKKTNNISIKLDDVEYIKLQALSDEMNITISTFIRNALTHYYNVKEDIKMIDERQIYDEKILSSVADVGSNQKIYFRNLIETLITISPKHKDIILEIWKDKNKS